MGALNLPGSRDVLLDRRQRDAITRTHCIRQVTQHAEILAAYVEQLQRLYVGTRKPEWKIAKVFQQIQKGSGRDMDELL